MARAVASSFNRLRCAFSPPPRPPPSLVSRRFLSTMSQAILPSLTPAACLGGKQCHVDRSGDSAYLPLNSRSSSFSDRPPSEMAPLFPGCDYNHWLIIIDKPGGCEIDEETSNKLEGLLGSQCVT